jgi:hypothetical protein
MNTNKSQIAATFVSNMHKANLLLRQLSEHVENHMGADPESLNWEDVGNAHAFVEDLKAVAEKAGIQQPQKHDHGPI